MSRHGRIEKLKRALISANRKLLLAVIFLGMLPCPVLQGQSDLMVIGNLKKQHLNTAEVSGNYILPSFINDEYLIFNLSIVQPKINVASTYVLRLDSIVELRSEGFNTTSARWYYYYSTSFQPDSVVTRYYNSLNMPVPKTEKRIYNSSGNLTRYIFQQLDPWRTDWYDSTLIDYYIDDYYYGDGKLARKVSTYNEYSPPQIEEHHYFYDTDGLLIQDISIYSGDTSSYMEYYYYPDGSLNYELEHYASDYDVRKFTYTQTDTSKLTLNQWRWYKNIPERPLLDTVSGWYTESYYYETFDETGRRTSMLLEYYGVEYSALYAENGKVYKSEYSYDDLNQSMHISYYDCIDTTAEGIWKEALRIDITYDDEGNPMTYQKDFYDDGTETWKIENRKDYYYSMVPVANPSEITSNDEILLFPNPAVDILYIKADVYEDAGYSIYTLTGIHVKNGILTNQPLDISQLQSGIYIIKIRYNETIASGKFIKK